MSALHGTLREPEPSWEDASCRICHSCATVEKSKGYYSLFSCNLTVQAWTTVARPHPQNFLRTPLNPASGGTTFREERDIQDQNSAWPVCCLSYWKGRYCWKETFQWICTYCAEYREKIQRVWKKGRTKVILEEHFASHHFHPDGRIGQFTDYIVWDAIITNGFRIYIALQPTYSR